MTYFIAGATVAYFRLVTRRIAENSTGNVGGPITATDANGDILTYSIRNDVLPEPASTIDPATGQLMVELTDTDLDFDLYGDGRR